MNQQEFTRLRTLELSLKRAFKPSVRVTSRRSSKHNSVGCILKSSKIHSQVGIERIFNKPGWTKTKA